MKRPSYIVAIAVFAIGLIVLVATHYSNLPPVRLEQRSSEDPPKGLDPAVSLRLSSRDVIEDAIRVRVASGGCSFLVMDRDTNRPIPDAAVCTAVLKGRGGICEDLGVTDQGGKLAMSWQPAESARFYARVRGGFAPFELDRVDQSERHTYYVAWVLGLPILRVRVTDQGGAPIAGVRLTASRKRIYPDYSILWGRDGGELEAWMPSEQIDAEFVGFTSADGIAEIRVWTPGRYFWVLSKPGYIPWGNDLKPTLQVPGDYSMLVSQLVGAALDVQNDEVVSLRALSLCEVHQESLEYMYDIQKYLKDSMGADLVVVAPSEPPGLRSDLEVDLLAKYSGQHKVLIPIGFVNSEFHAYVYRPEGVNRSESRSGRISLRWKLADGSSAERIRWLILGAGSSKYGVGDAELELGPGSYVVQPVQRALARKGFDIEASERAEVVFELPDSVVSCAFRLATPRGLVAVPKDTTIIIERGDNVVESYRTSEEAESIDLWLPPGRFHVTMYAPSYDVPEAWVDILANERGDMQKQVLKVYARDL